MHRTKPGHRSDRIGAGRARDGQHRELRTEPGAKVRLQAAHRLLAETATDGDCAHRSGRPRR